MDTGCGQERNRHLEAHEQGRRGVEEGAGVRLERRRRYAWPGDSSYIELSMCVDTVSCNSLRNKLFLLAQRRASSSLWRAKCNLSVSTRRLCSSALSSPRITSVSLSSVPTQYNHLERLSCMRAPFDSFLFWAR